MALRLVCEREGEIEAFQRQKYWSVEADLLMPKGSNLEVGAWLGAAAGCCRWLLPVHLCACHSCRLAARMHPCQASQLVLTAPGLTLPAQARITEVDGAAPPQPGYLDQKEAAAITKRVAAAQFEVEATSSREQQRQPPAPFTTSTLQQEANNRLGLSEWRGRELHRA